MEENEEVDPIRQQVESICEAAIQRCHDQMAKKNPSIAEVRHIMFVVREAWYLLNDRYDDMLGDISKYEGYMGEEDDEEFGTFDDEDDGPPHPLK